MADYDVIVIGAGLGGLTSGSILAKQGRKTLVVEQGERLGGCCSTFEREGYKFDVGASIVEVIKPIEMAFEMLGTSLADEVDLIPCDPVYAASLRDDSKLVIPYSLEGTGEVISSVSPEDGRRWFDFAKFFKGFMDEAMKGFFTSPADTMTDMARIFMKAPGMLKYAPLFVGTYEGAMARFFKDPKILESFAYQAFYLGLPPELVPGVFALLPYSEHEGVFYPRGGMGAIPEAIAAVGQRHGLEIRLDTRIYQVIVREGRATGVMLEDGTEITADVVVSNINAKKLYLDLIGEQFLNPLAKRGIKSYPLSLSVPMLYVGLDYAPPLDAHHTIICASPEELDDYWWNKHLKGKLPDKQFGLVCWPTKSDPGLAPEGHHALNVILMGPSKLEGTDWDAEKPAFIESAIEFIDKHVAPGISEHVVFTDLATPLDFERRLLHPEGAIYAVQQDITAQAVFRPNARSRSIKGLYLAGASTHPGGGVPTCIGSGIIAADLVDKYEN
ncbi:MAG: phytoene desaturase family protein [Candidatus Geothermincolia bacterium]